MGTIVMMLAAFLLLTGIAMMLAGLARVNLMEGFFLAASAVMGILYLSGLVLKSFQPGWWLLLLMGAAGFIWSLAGICKKKLVSSAAFDVSGFLHPAYWILVLVLLYGMIAFYGVFLQHVDEFHLWAPVVRGMLQQDRRPDWAAYGSVQMYGASFFQLFFLKLTGYSEQAMYAASFLMTWIGFLLPVSSMEKKDWRKVILYSLILFFSIYSLYRYNYKALYVDLLCASWAGGLASWWCIKKRRIQREEVSKSEWNRPQRIVLIAGLITLCFLKTYVGCLMASLVLLFLLFDAYGSRIEAAGPSAMKRFYTCAGGSGLLIVLVFCGTLLYMCKSRSFSMFPDGIRSQMNASEVSMEKAIRTMGALANAFLGKKMGPHSRLEVYPFAFLLLLIIWLIVGGWVSRRELISRIRSCYVVVSSILYLMFLTAAFILLFSYQEAVKVAGITRYLNILLIYLFLICLNCWMFEDNKPGNSDVAESEGKANVKSLVTEMRRDRVVEFVNLLVLLFFAWGVNDRFISDATAFNEYQIGGSKDIQEAGKEGKTIRKGLTDSDKVFFINQGTSNEFPQNVAYYYLEGQVSNYLSEPWRFTEDGCEVRIQEYEYPTIQDLPRLLAEGGYTCLWVYDTNEYLAESLTTVFETDLSADEMADGQLYRVIYSDGAATGLKLEKQLNKEALTLAEERAEEEYGNNNRTNLISGAQSDESALEN